jgi:hypothetical protein
VDWHTVKASEKRCMQEQLRRDGTPEPKVAGIDEISIKKRHTYPFRTRAPGRGMLLRLGRYAWPDPIGHPLVETRN